ncbi:DUF2505 family protein [Chondromyces crocatus]|uniref:Uncharacterized protein n=1 Tax=Chondromyces crocatus TaxID=52 RepID=A0A0K1E6R7_CHOCO|nr:DUF2505 family protein [Chondromyces crocatus]AKT36268.1 uncharacterized protein CMC5_003820 [Chondromyces crocatus]
MRFSIVHELDAPFDAVSLALLSPELGPRLGQRVNSLESVVTVEHAIHEGEMRRVLRFQAAAPLSVFKGYDLARDAMAWDEIFHYKLAGGASSWRIAPVALEGSAGSGEKKGRERWKDHFRAEGTYRLEALPGGRTRRSVEGMLDVRLSMIGALVERMALVEVRKTYDAEADTLRELAVV